MNYIDCVQAERLVEKVYKENIVFEWLKKPCMSLSHDKRRLSPANVFSYCFEVLDTLKRYDRQDMYRIENRIECLPHEIEELLVPANYDLFDDHSTEDRILLSVLFYALLRIADDKNIQMCSSILNDWPLILSEDYKKKFIVSQQSWIETVWFDTMTNSAIYRHSEAIAEGECKAFEGEVYLQGYIREYMQSDEQISDEIDAIVSGKAGVSGDQAEPATSEAVVERTPIRVAKRKKQKTMAILGAMFYAGYFTSEDEAITSRDHYVSAIMKYGFSDEVMGGFRSGLSSKAENSKGLDEWKKELRKALDEGLEDLQYIQSPTKTGKKK